MRVMKFGGTSVRDAERISAAADLVRESTSQGPVCVVVSALGGVTDDLQEVATATSRDGFSFEETCRAIAARHHETAAAVAAAEDLEALHSLTDSRLADLRRTLEGVSLVGECSPRILDKILSFGELLSSELMAACLRQKGLEAEACDARRLILTDDNFGAARVEVDATYERIRSFFADCSAIQVVTGFLASTEDGEVTTLGRGGSDYTASLLGAALSAERIEIWTDVDGIMSADPRLVPGAFSLPRLSYDELLELSHFGAKVVYPPTVHPARSGSVPLVIKNTLNPSHPGTVVEESPQTSGHPIRGISAIPRIAMLRLEGDGMSAIPDPARRLFRVLAREHVNVILISQASSEHSICVAIEPDKAAMARTAIHEEFEREKRLGLIDDLVVDEELAVVAVVGAGMSSQPGISGRLFSALGEAGINVRAIAQGSSELNISFAIAARDKKRVLRTLHAAFFEQPPIHLFLAGVGGVGGTLLEQLRESLPAHWSLSGLANSRHMSLDRDRLDTSLWHRELLETADTAASDLEVWRDFILDSAGQRVMIDCTASDTIEEIYADLLRQGVSIVTANKKPLASTRKISNAIHAAAEEGSAGLYFEATVGAGLPVIRTLQDQIRTGDRVHRVEGVFSGTLGYLMSETRRGRRFSEAVRDAHQQGYTEPDPRQDLSGADVARKLLILARLTGADLELDDIQVESLLPSAEWAELSLEEFWSRLPELDEPFGDRMASAGEQGRVLAYLGSWRDGTGRVGLEAVEPDHPCARIEGTDNLFAFTTRRYGEQPLVVQGPGAGPQVTAAGVYSDLLRALAEGRRR